jgi:ketopantoate reductase
MNILIYGAGPLGSLFAVRLVEAGHQVSVLARGQRLKELQEHGVVIQDSISGAIETAQVQLVETLEQDDAYDLIMVVMRKNHALKILPLLAANRNSPNVLFMMNNAGGQDVLIEALGKERVMVGFPYPGGERDGHIMHVVPVNENKNWTLPIGEVDGRITERAHNIAEILRSMRGYDVEIRTDMDAWLKYHVAVVVPGLAAGLYAADTDLERMGRTPDALILAVRGMKEAVRSLKKAGVSPSPAPLGLLEYMPEPLMVWLLKRASTTKLLKVGGEGHARAARDEMKLLAEELITLLHQSGVQTPLLNQLFPYFEPETPPIPEGSSAIPMNWRELVIPALVGLAVTAILFRPRRRRG